MKVRRGTASLREAGVDGVATIVEGDAFAFLREQREPIDFVFLDAEKEDYTAFLELIVPLLPPGGLLTADNPTSHADDLAECRRGVPLARMDGGGVGRPSVWRKRPPSGVTCRSRSARGVPCSRSRAS